MTQTTYRPRYGREVPSEMYSLEITDAWSCRAIVTPMGELDLVHNRITHLKRNHSQAFAEFVSGQMKALRKFAEAVDPSSSEIYSFHKEPFYCEASPQSSHGYLYITIAEYGKHTETG